ncbi:MAG: Rho termination factor N-terminal domain-containing protein, partial [Aeoliella sp.]
MTTTTLRTYTCKDLAKMAKEEGVAGWHSMRKEELIHALANAARRSKRRKEKAKTSGKPAAATNGKAASAQRLTPAQRRAKSRIEALRTRLAELK